MEVKKYYKNTESEMIRNFAPDATIEETTSRGKGKFDILESFSRSNVVVMDYPGTSMHICMALNIPILLYWDTDDWSFSKDADRIFKEMRKVGILCKSGKKLADFINKEEISIWWNSADVQKVREQFVNLFARCDDNWTSSWLNVLKVLTQ
jgi:putative transferase (TIGR04331 family)